MTAFTLSLAGVPIRVEALFESTARYCKDYITDEAPALCVRVTQADIGFEQEKSASEYGVCRYSDAYLEILAVYRKIAAAAHGGGPRSRLRHALAGQGAARTQRDAAPRGHLLS